MLAERFRQARERAQLSIYALAKKTRVGVATISDIETGKNQNPGLVTMAKLGQELHVTLDYLAGLTDDPHPRQRRKRPTPGAAASP
jgi:transcriptional regulator with XRE-family HTH domain